MNPSADTDNRRELLQEQIDSIERQLDKTKSTNE